MKIIDIGKINLEQICQENTRRINALYNQMDDIIKNIHDRFDKVESKLKGELFL